MIPLHVLRTIVLEFVQMASTFRLGTIPVWELFKRVAPASCLHVGVKRRSIIAMQLNGLFWITE
jgi:hypothetical protein